MEKVYLKFLKKVLSVRYETPNVTVYGELGKVPLDILRKERILKYWYRIVNAQETLVYKCLLTVLRVQQIVRGY